MEKIIWKRIADLRKTGLSHNDAVATVAYGIASFIADSVVEGGPEISDKTLERYKYAKYLLHLI